MSHSPISGPAEAPESERFLTVQHYKAKVLDALEATGLRISELFDEPKGKAGQYVPLKRSTFDLGPAGVWDRERLANHMAHRSAQAELVNTLGPELLALSDPDALAALYLEGRHDY